MTVSGFPDDAEHRLVSRAISIASESDERCQPVHLLAALEEVEGFASVLQSLGRRWLHPRALPSTNRGGGLGYLAAQTVRAARQFAESCQVPFAPGHLAVALIDQADATVLGHLSTAEIDPSTVRTVALKALGVSLELAPLPMPEPWPAGTQDRPPLLLAQLDPAAWARLVWRQDHLPLRRVKRQTDWAALLRLEIRAVFRLADRRALDDNQRYSLLSYHIERVEELAHQAHPDLVIRRRRKEGQLEEGRPLIAGYQRRPRWRRSVPNFMAGWPCWFSNRRMGLRDKYFRLVTAPAYWGQPQAVSQ